MAMRNNFPILIVDDDLSSVKFLEKMLIKVGHEVTMAQSGLEALNLFKQHFFPNRPIGLDDAGP